MNGVFIDLNQLLEIASSIVETANREKARTILKSKSYVKRDAWGYNSD